MVIGKPGPFLSRADFSKRLQLMKEVSPRSARVAVIDFKYVDSLATPGTHRRRVETEAAAQRLGLAVTR